MAKAPKDDAPKDSVDPIVARAFDKSAKEEDLVAAIKQLRPEEAAFFVGKLEATFKKRKIQATGYIVGMAVWLVGMVGALWYVGATEGFAGWVFLVPFAALGATLWIFGAYSERVGRKITPYTPPADGEPPERSKSSGAAKPV